MSVINRLGSDRFVKFLLVGGLAALVNFFSRIGFSQYVSFSVAVLLAFPVAMTTAFVLSKKYVFTESSQSVFKQYYYFFLVNIFAAIQVWVISVGLAEYLFIWLDYHFFREELAHMIGIIVPVFTSYIGHKKFSFK